MDGPAHHRPHRRPVRDRQPPPPDRRQHRRHAVPGGRPQRRTAAAQGRSGDVSRQVRRSEHVPLLHRTPACRTDGTQGAARRTRACRRQSGIRAALPTRAGDPGRRTARCRGTDPLASSDARPGHAGTLRAAGRAKRPDRYARPLDHRAGPGRPRHLGRGRPAAGAPRDQPVACTVPRSGPGRTPAGRACPPSCRRRPRRTGADRDGVDARPRRRPPDHGALACTRAGPGRRRLRHRLLVAVLPQALPGAETQDRQELRAWRRRGRGVGRDLSIGDRTRSQPRPESGR